MVSMSPPAFEWILVSVVISYGGPIVWGLLCSRFRTRIGLTLLFLPFLLLAFYVGLGNLWVVSYYFIGYIPYLALGYLAGLWWKQRKKGAGTKVPMQT